jgi:hypothetical protein
VSTRWRRPLGQTEKNRGDIYHYRPPLDDLLLWRQSEGTEGGGFFCGGGCEASGVTREAVSIMLHLYHILLYTKSQAKLIVRRYYILSKIGLFFGTGVVEPNMSRLS